MKPAQAIIERFGGQTALAEAIGKPQSTVQYWNRTGTIPAKWHSLIIKAAEIKGVEVAPSDFVAPVEPEGTALGKSPVARWPGQLSVGDQEIPVYVLDDGRRVISRTGALNFLTGGKGGGNLESYLEVEVLRPFLPADLAEQWVEFDIPQVVNKSVKGMTAGAFIDICRAYSRARDTGALTTDSQVGIAVRASMLLAAFAKTGIEAAIDEVTGYQFERPLDALQTKLRLFLADEMRPWEKTFPVDARLALSRSSRPNCFRPRRGQDRL
jgi:hypothetical protein